MIMHRHSQSFFRVLLADAKFVQLPFDLSRLGNAGAQLRFFGLRGCEFLVEDVFTKDNAIIADVNAGTGNELFNFRVRFAAETAERDVRWSSHDIIRFRLTILRAAAELFFLIGQIRRVFS